MMKKNLFQRVCITVCVAVLIIFVIFLIIKVSEMQGDARVINFAGKTRGATQQLVKQELAGVENDALIAKLDIYLGELSTGSGSSDVKRLQCPEYLLRLEEQVDAWGELKESIYLTRSDGAHAQTLYLLSEAYYDITDATVDAAEMAAARTARTIETLEGIVTLICFFIVLLLLWQLYDLIKIAGVNTRLQTVAYVDRNTGLPSRARCDEKIEELEALEARGDLCFFMFDLNNLKTTNDKLGHSAGDELIKRFALALRESAPKGMFVGRYGGDEFIGVLEDATGEEIEAFLASLEHHVREQNKKLRGFAISYAHGYAHASPGDGQTIEELLGRADMAMYQRKAQMKGEAQSGQAVQL